MLEDTNNRRNGSAPAQTKTSEQEYKVGPGRPPKEYQFKPGQSGNPKGAKRKPKSKVACALDLAHQVNAESNIRYTTG
jgi:hypothetical protein